MAETILPRYGERSLCEVTPSLLAALGVPGLDNVLGVERVSAACLLVIDGLGWDLLQAHAEDAPTPRAGCGRIRRVGPAVVGPRR